MNRLSQETSPYLLQHAYNPVDWYAWSDEALAKAKSENKPILVSIGYSACHWCHVMERECFEKEDIAAVMNEHFVCIKVDREERPDVDAVYMDAVQAMGVRGGWPLNVFLLPDAKPFYGVTYLPAPNWVQLLKSIDNAFTNHYDELAGSAQGFVDNMVLSETEKYGLNAANGNYSVDDLDEMFEQLKKHFDTENGGTDRAPKFPMPSIYKFLLRYYDVTQNPEALAQLELSLNRIALGGIYDHAGGGWARYSVDEDWFIPHFEKMLYDNAQLLSIYSEAFMLTQNELYSDRIRQTISWLKNEMLSQGGGFYSALDADSEGIEGKFYIWTEDELKDILKEDFSWFAKLYNVSKNGNWEHGYNHLHLTNFASQTAKALGIYTEQFEAKYKAALEKLVIKRAERIRPGLDDKILTSWNGLLIKGLTDAYRALGDESIREMAVSCGKFIASKVTLNGQLRHSYKNQKASITGFLEDYAAVMEGYLGLYQITFDESWINQSRLLADYTIDNFYDQTDGYFFFTDAQGEALIARKKELFDNVVPASNSIMATNMYTLGKILDREDYLSLSDQMLLKMHKILKTDLQWVTNWGALYCLRLTPTAEVVFVGSDADSLRKDLDRFFIPNKVVLGTATTSGLPLIQGRTDRNGKALIYVCFDKTCQLPVESVREALEQISG
ncbi:thioredoxin domain-containing protein [Dyadobacter psychrotolerans]|uniref:Thioredoxin domain-containing protein n=1 Tax=Dyadobacter psychrotolerans TaxID=2541721 RepID=A0A4R5DFE2_9BACT|nr:thioredoxin domain-containing protein [Dyadobacter psychrotolerans]TDE10474.1 thioredoxin domain-containing protein [Dyadobacter psychrotolerans]